jgi:uncharacterized repeat protein (TIGR01451 family)/gliding motility-associated-like protein
VVTYTPTLNYNGSAVVSYAVNDNIGATSNAGTLTITVNAVNDAPVAINDATSTNEDSPVTYNVTTNDTDVDGTINSASVDLDPTTGGVQTSFNNAAGNWSVNTSGVVTYTPTLNYNGSAIISYTINDNNSALSNIATLTITVTAVNDAPVAANDATSTNEDEAVTYTVTTNDTDVDGTINVATVDLDPSTFGIQTTFSNAAGSWSVNSSGVVTYSPTLNYNGSAAISYTVNDNIGLTSNSASLTIIVNAVNDAPVAANDATSTNEDVSTTFNVTTNDTDVDGTINATTVDLDPSTGGIQTSFSNAAGSWSVNSSGLVTFTPTLNYIGSAIVTYTINDNSGATSNAGTLTITVNAVNDAPVAVNDATSTNEDVSTTFNVTTNDTDVDGTINANTVDLDPSTGGIQTSFSNAAGLWSVNSSGVVTYTPTLNYNGSAVVSYTVNDNIGATSNTGTLTITVNAVNDAPVAVNDATFINEDVSTTFDVTTNDTDVDGTISANTVDLDPTTGGIQNSYSNATGSWSVNSSGVVTYNPTLNYTGNATVSYTVSDNSGATSNAGTLTITVNALNDAPVAVDDATSTNEDSPVTYNVTTNDTDVDGTINATTVDLDPSTGGIQTSFSNAAGSWSVNSSGVVTYTPTLNYNGSAVVSYTVNDNSGATSNTGTLTITVNAVNDAPVAVNDATSTNEDVSTTFNVTTNDTDVDGTINANTVDLDPSTGGIQTTFSNAAGSWSVNSSGVVTYTPTLNYNGSAVVSYAVNDNSGSTSNTGTLTITVTAVNDAPVAVNDATSTNEDVSVTYNVTTNDTDVDGTINVNTVDLDPSTGGIQTTFSNASGSWSVNSSGVVTYTPTLNYNGSAVVSYTVNDNSGAISNTGTLTITVTAVNDAPVAVNDATSTNEDVSTTLNVATNDTDVDGTINANTVDLDPSTGGIQTSFSNAAGSWSVNSSGVVTFTPTLNYNGSAVVSYTVNDNSGATSNAGTLTITVNAVNDAPVAVDDATSTNEDSSVTYNVTTNDTDVDGTIEVSTVDLDPVAAGMQNSYINIFGSWSVNNAGLVTFTPTPDFHGSATVSYTLNDNDGAVSNIGVLTVTVNESSDLALTKIVNNSTTLIGENVIFTITVKNNGPSNATNVIVTDNIPDGYTYVSANPSVGSWTGPDWSVGNLLEGESANIQITATVNASGNYTNSASVICDQPDPIPGNDISNVTVNPGAVSDLHISKTVDNANPDVGENVIFTIEVTNNGPSDATGVEVTDILPNGYTFVSANASIGSWSAPTWTIGNLAIGETETMEITATVLAKGSYSNTASVIADQPDPVGGDEEDVVSINGSDLVITKTMDNNTPGVDENVVFTISVTNNGPRDATGVEVIDNLPDGYTFVSANPSVGSWTAPIWTIGNITNGETVTLEITATVKASGNHSNTAVVTGNQPDPVSGNEESTVAPTLSEISDLHITKTVNNSNPNVGDNVIFTITIVNNGPSNATGVVVTDNLPSGYSFISANTSTGNWASPDWNIGNLANGESATLDITASVNAFGDYRNIASVTANQHDPIPGDEVDAISINCSDLDIVKTIDNSNPNVNDNVVFTITVTNNGSRDATGVVVTDNLPSGYAFVSANPSVGSWSSSDWTIGDLAIGATATLDITATVNATGNYNNIASLLGNQPDSLPGNNTDNENLTNLADLSITKTVDNLSAMPGTNVIFTITVTNIGNADAKGVKVTDNLPDGYTFVSANASVGSWSAPEWTIGDLANGNNVSLEITATVNESGNYDNTAVVMSNQPDPGPGNETDDASVTPLIEADLSIVKSVDDTVSIVGGNVVFTLLVTNNGPGTATNVLVNDILPTGFSFVSDNGSGAYNSNTGNWIIGTLTDGQSVSLQIIATVNESGNYTNDAMISGNETDQDIDNNTSEVTVEVNKTLIVSEGISPNHDGKNDKWVVVGLEQYPNHKVMIFNRWGNKVFEASPYLNDWEGTNMFGISVGGKELPVGTYFYIIEPGNGEKAIKGYIYLNK